MAALLFYGGPTILWPLLLYYSAMIRQKAWLGGNDGWTMTSYCDRGILWHIIRGRTLYILVRVKQFNQSERDF
jgi:hypothetical protein